MKAPDFAKLVNPMRVAPCLEITGTRRAYFYKDVPDYLVTYYDKPYGDAAFNKKEFEARFATFAPTPAVQKIFDSMLPYTRWLEINRWRFKDETQGAFK